MKPFFFIVIIVITIILATIVSSKELVFQELYCALTGCTMAGDINMGNYSIYNAHWINATKTNLSINYTSLYDEHWVNESGDTMTGDLVIVGDLTLHTINGTPLSSFDNNSGDDLHNHSHINITNLYISDTGELVQRIYFYNSDSYENLEWNIEDQLFYFSAGFESSTLGTSGDIYTTSGNIKVDQDNTKLLVGEGQDASVYYDGTDMVINPKEVGSGDLKVLGVVSNLTVDKINVQTNISMQYNDTHIEFTPQGDVLLWI